MLYYFVSSIINVFLIILIVDFVLMGFFSFRFSVKSKKTEFVITRENKIDFQTNVECAGFSCAYILRHFGTEANGKDVYQKIPNKMKDGCVYPKQIKKFLKLWNTSMLKMPVHTHSFFIVRSMSN